MVKAREDLAPKSDDILTRDVSLNELNNLFDTSTGHDHDGSNSAKIDYNDLINTPDYSYMYYSLTMPVNEFDVTDNGEGTLDVTWLDQTTRTFLAAPTNSTGQPLFRNIVLNDIPDLSSLYASSSHSHTLNDLSNVNTTHLTEMY